MHVITKAVEKEINDLNIGNPKMPKKVEVDDPIYIREHLSMQVWKVKSVSLRYRIAGIVSVDNKGFEHSIRLYKDGSIDRVEHYNYYQSKEECIAELKKDILRRIQNNLDKNKEYQELIDNLIKE